jgi:predicted SAM-dependent methyltransferase
MNRRLLNLGCGAAFHPSWINLDYQPNSPYVQKHDLKAALPFDANSMDVVYHSHVIEHLPRRLASFFVQECFRVLRADGIIRVVIPDLERLARLYIELLDRSLEGDTVAQARCEWIMIEMLDQMVRTRSGGEMLKYWMHDPMPAEDFVIERVGSEAVNVIQRLRGTQESRALLQESPDADDPGEVGAFRLSGEVHQWMYDRYSLKCLLEKAGFVRSNSAGQTNPPSRISIGICWILRRTDLCENPILFIWKP